MTVDFQYLISRRLSRHVLFWTAWVLGFTFIKSIEASLSVYFSWLVYYLLTLPLFSGHTYLVAYVLVPRYFNRKRMPVFLIAFILAFYAFSMAEMCFTSQVLHKWVTLLPVSDESWRDPVDVLRSGLGNLYIVLVFLAAKNLWEWSRSRIREKELHQGSLQVQLAETMTRVQPLMLMHAIDHLDRMVEEKSPGISRAIALTSELLSEVMMFHEEGERWMTREIGLVRKLIELHTLLRGRKPEVEFFISGDTGSMDLPPMILFSMVDLIFRSFDFASASPEVHIEVSGFSNMLSLQVLYSDQQRKQDRSKECMDALTQMKLNYDGQVHISSESHPYGCSVIIKATHHEEEDDYPVEHDGA